MTHHFEVSDAEKYGVHKAILLYNIRFWLNKNKANGSHIHDGYYWTYNSSKAFAELFPYMNAGTIKNWLLELEQKDGILMSGCYNEQGLDKTKWYTIPSEYALNQRQTPIASTMQSDAKEPTTIAPTMQSIAPTMQSIAPTMQSIAPTMQALYDTDVNTDSKPNISSSGENFSELVLDEFRRQKPDLPQTALIDEVNLFEKKYKGQEIKNLPSLVKIWVGKVDWSRYSLPPENGAPVAEKKALDIKEAGDIVKELNPKLTPMQCYDIAAKIHRRFGDQKFADTRQFVIDTVTQMQRPDYVEKVTMTYHAILSEVRYLTKGATDGWQRYIADKVYETWKDKPVQSFEELMESFVYDAKNKRNLFAAQ